MPLVSSIPPVKRGPDQTFNAPPNTFKTPTAGVGAAKRIPTRTRGLVHLYCDALDVRLSCRHAEYPQVTQERAGGWLLVERPKLEPLTDWQGPQALRVTLKLLFDGYGTRPKSIKPDLDQLRLFGYRVASLDRPPSIIVVGKVPYSGGGLSKGSEDEPPQWVIESLEIVDEIYTADGDPCRSTATVKLLKFTPATAKTRTPKKSAAKPYEWKAGDTLASVAKDRLGSTSRRSLIDDANPKIKSWSKVPVGTKITIPGLG